MKCKGGKHSYVPSGTNKALVMGVEATSNISDLSVGIKRRVTHIDKLINTIDHAITGLVGKEEQKLPDTSVIYLLTDSCDRMDVLISRLEKLVASVIPENADQESQEGDESR